MRGAIIFATLTGVSRSNNGDAALDPLHERHCGAVCGVRPQGARVWREVRTRAPAPTHSNATGAIDRAWPQARERRDEGSASRSQTLAGAAERRDGAGMSERLSSRQQHTSSLPLTAWAAVDLQRDDAKSCRDVRRLHGRPSEADDERPRSHHRISRSAIAGAPRRAARGPCFSFWRSPASHLSPRRGATCRRCRPRCTG
jgi:hypothetical protein